MATVDTSFEVNYLQVGAMTDPLDDFYGAVGRAILKAAVSGKVTNGADGRPVSMQVAAVGIYLRDTYDFVGDQFLGVWSEGGVNRSRIDELVASRVSLYPPIAVDRGEYDSAVAADRAAAAQPSVSAMGGLMIAPQLSPSEEAEALRRRWYSVSNGDFGRYRRKAAKGHDYVNVSDVRVVRLPMPSTLRSEALAWRVE